MKKINKYKYISDHKKRLKLSLRILKFKRPKWNRLKKYVFKTLKSKTRFKRRIKRKRTFRLINPYKQKVQIGWQKIRKSYKNWIVFKRTLLLLSGNNPRRRSNLVNLKEINKYSRKNLYLFKRIYFLNSFAQYINISSSNENARKLIESRLLYVNNKTSNSKLMKKGDIVSFLDFDYNFYRLKKKYINLEGVTSFFEYDYYSQSFAILKDLNEISQKDGIFIDKNIF